MDRQGQTWTDMDRHGQTGRFVTGFWSECVPLEVGARAGRLSRAATLSKPFQPHLLLTARSEVLRFLRFLPFLSGGDKGDQSQCRAEGRGRLIVRRT